MTALVVILIIIAIFALLLHIPVRIKVYAKYENSRLVSDYRIKYGFITAKKRSEKKEKKKTEKTEDKTKKDKPSPLLIIRFIKENIELVKRFINDVVGYTTKKLIKFEKFKLTAVFGTEDAMDTALIYGGASAFLYNTVGFMERKIRMKNIMIDFKPDFTEPKIFIELESIIRTKIYNVIGLAWVALLRAMPLVKKRGEINNGKSN